MFEYLEKLRQQPEGLRKRIAFLSALGFSLIILAVLVTVLYPDWHDGQTQQAKAEAMSPSPLSTFGSTLGDGFAAIGSQFGLLKNSISVFNSDAVHFSATSSEAAAIQSEGLVSTSTVTTPQ